MPLVKRYQTLEKTLKEVLRKFGDDSSETDNVLDEMDAVWDEMTPQQRRVVDPERPARYCE